VRAEFEPICRERGIIWPPEQLQLLVFKKESQLEVWGANHGDPLSFLRKYPVLAMSGTTGVKRREADDQVPEGFYKLTNLNPQSTFHLSIRVDYPNEEDIAHAVVSRKEMGGDIYIHGSKVSIGCIAVGDETIEKLFVLAALSKHREVLISPVDFRTTATLQRSADAWVTDLYARIAQRLKQFPNSGQ
jgi:murein L,D-transpeptidase YafK